MSGVLAVLLTSLVVLFLAEREGRLLEVKAYPSPVICMGLLLGDVSVGYSGVFMGSRDPLVVYNGAVEEEPWSISNMNIQIMMELMIVTRTR